MMERRCWICGAALRPFWRSAALEVVECRACHHLGAEHRPAVKSPASDYHLAYDQDRFVRSLAATRQRQAARVLDALERHGSVGSVLDFGCGRGWFLEAARRHGVARLAGADVSDLALELLRQQAIPALQLDAALPFERLQLSELGFVPEVISFLDVLEHFSGNLAQRLRPWFDALPPSVRRIVIKVPVRDGLLFALADGARRVGVPGPLAQLFQVGTEPPHQQYFSRASLERFVQALGLRTIETLDDLDFEPELLAERLATASGALRLALGGAGRALGTLASGLERTDSRIVIAERG
jgi:SAM-dependent methyltransferase